MTILPTGDVYACRRMESKIGNVFDASMYDLFMGVNMEQYRDLTFDNEVGMELLKEWGIPNKDIARCFVILGYCDGRYPQMKPRKDNRFSIIG